MGLFGGNDSSSPAEASPQAVAPQQSYMQSTQSTAPQCQEYSRLFLQCMDQNGNQIGMCNDYMEMMKACQQQYSS